MSVQAGIWNFDGRPPNNDLLIRVSEAMRLNGPDNSASYSDSSVALIYRAFNTTGESKPGTQPYIFENGRVLVWDGRLDNRSELAEELNIRLSDAPNDCHIVATAFDEWGRQCLQKLIGDWALTLWDPRKQTLLLAKDFVGPKPLYYELTHRYVFWCTHLEPMVFLSNRRFGISEEYIAAYFASHPPAHLTPYVGIASVPPGAFVEIRAGTITVQEYWSCDTNKRIIHRTDQDYEEHFRHVFRRAVKRRLRSDSPVLAELSGGMDSTSIVCVADELIASGEGDVPRLDTVSYYDDEEPSWDERPYFTKVEEKRGRAGCHIDIGQDSRSTFLGPGHFVAVPGSTAETIALELKRAVLTEAQGNRVLLSGIGGDEFLGGVPTPLPELATLLARGNWLKLARQLRAWSLSSRQPWTRLLMQTAGAFLPMARMRASAAVTAIPAWIEPRLVERYSDTFHSSLRFLLLDKTLPSQQALKHSLSHLRAFIGCSPTTTLGRLETRYPYLDRELYEFVLAIPREQLVRPGQRRSLMRRAHAHVVPDEILNRKRKAFAARSLLVTLGEHQEYLQHMFEAPLTQSNGYIVVRPFLESLQLAIHGRLEHMLSLIKTVRLELWLRSLEHHKLLLYDSPSYCAPSCGSSTFFLNFVDLKKISAQRS